MASKMFNIVYSALTLARNKSLKAADLIIFHLAITLLRACVYIIGPELSLSVSLFYPLTALDAYYFDKHVCIWTTLHKFV